VSDKQGALSTLREEFDRWESLLASLSEAQITAPEFAENWSIKDVVAHLRAWQQRSLARLEAALHNREPVYPAWPEQFDPEEEGQPHDLNTWLYEQDRDKSWADVRQGWRAGFLRLLELANAIPEDGLRDKDKYPWLEGYALIDVLQGSLEHHREHAEYLEPMLARLRQQP
jgi:hypothetical protein